MTTELTIFHPLVNRISCAFVASKSEEAKVEKKRGHYDGSRIQLKDILDWKPDREHSLKDEIPDSTIDDIMLHERLVLEVKAALSQSSHFYF